MSLFLFNCYYYFIVVQLQLFAFSPHRSPPYQPNPPPSLTSSLPLGFAHVYCIGVPENPSNISISHTTWLDTFWADDKHTYIYTYQYISIYTYTDMYILISIYTHIQTHLLQLSMKTITAIVL